MWSARLFAAGVLLACSLSPFAETQAADTADCTGVVVDETGVPVAAAQVKLEDTSGHTRRTETDATGHFAFRALAAGDYKAEVRKEGFFVLAGQPFTLHSGANEISMTLNHEQEIHEQVQVSAQANPIDTQDTTQRSALSARDIRDIPVPNSHVLQQSLVALPEIVQDHAGNLHVAGARSADTQYLLDGFEIGDPASGALTSRFNVDATRAAEIQTGRIGAGYAHSGAGILSLETPDGDNRWRFGTTNPVPGINIQEGTHLGNWYPRFAFSGPIERGKFWFSDSVSIQHTFAVIRGLPAGANTAEDWAGDNLLRLQYNITTNQILHASFLYNRAHDDNLGLDSLDPQSTTTTAEQRRGFVSLKDQISLHNNTLFELGVAADTSTLEYVPQGTQPYLLLVDGASGNYFQRLHERGRRIQGVGAVTTVVNHWIGTHQFAAGFNAAGLRFSQSAVRGEMDALQATNPLMSGAACAAAIAGCLVKQTTFTGPATPKLSNTQAGAYVQDTWSLSKRFVLQPGLRADWDRFTQSYMTGPRLSANFLPFADDQAKLSLGWGIYNAPLNLSLIAQALDQEQIDTFFDPKTGLVTPPGPVASQFVLPASGLRQPRFTISSVGWQQKIGRNTLVGLELLARNGYHGFAFVDQNPAQPGGLFLLQDHRKDRYRSATISIRHAFSDDFQLFGAFTRSRARSDEVLNPALGSLLFSSQQSAPLAWDAPNRLVTWGWAPTHIWSVQLTYFFEYRTGYPFSVVDVDQQLVDLPNSLRFPGYANLNFGLERRFELRGYVFAVRGEEVNVLNRQNPDAVVNNNGAPVCTSLLTQGCFGAFSGGQGRSFTVRVRFIGKKILQ